MNKFQNKYRIPTARAQWHGYDGGIYFVTICTAERLHLFGEITDSQMLLSDVGRIAYDNFANVTVHYSYAEIPLFTIMPNHIHAIVIINGNGDNGRDAINRVSTTSTVPTVISRNSMIFKSLGTVIRGVKARISHAAHQNRISFAWQSRFHDRIIRNQEELNRIAEYIENNVAKWDKDEMNICNNNNR